MAAFEIDDEFVVDEHRAPCAITHSFELYPPRSISAERGLEPELEALAASGPEFISVTFGAAGTTTERSLGVIEQVLGRTTVTAMAHLTCVGTSHAEAAVRIREFLDAGVRHFLALRGDPPAGARDVASVLGDLRSAAELVQLIRLVQREREPFGQRDIPGVPGAKRITKGEPVTVAVAAFPAGHPDSRSRAQDLDALLAKEAAGANLAITQLVFDQDEYFGFVDEARAAGVRMRILPGITPVPSAARLERIAQVTGLAVPTPLLARLEAASDPEAEGIAAAAELGAALVSGGAPGLHLYTFNRAAPSLAALAAAGVIAPNPVTGKEAPR